MNKVKYVCKHCDQEEVTILECEHNETEDWCFNCEDSTTIIEIKESENGSSLE